MTFRRLKVQHCNVFHCDLQCRLDSGRTACALYENDPRRRSSMIGVRRMTCEMHITVSGESCSRE